MWGPYRFSPGFQIRERNRDTHIHKLAFELLDLTERPIQPGNKKTMKKAR
jgi:hypothetical protein